MSIFKRTKVAPNPMIVRRIDHGSGSHIEPPLDQSWPELDRLRWFTSVVRVDAGVHVEVEPAVTSGMGSGPYYNLHYTTGVGSGVSGPYRYRDVWLVLSGFTHGVNAAGKKQDGGHR